MTYTEKAMQLRPVMEQAAQSLEDAVALTAKELFPQWELTVESGKTLRHAVAYWYDEVEEPAKETNEEGYKQYYVPQLIHLFERIMPNEMDYSVCSISLVLLGHRPRWNTVR